MKIKIITPFIIAAMLLTSCGTKQAETPDTAVDNSYVGDNTQAAQAEKENIFLPVDDEVTANENSAVVSAMLDSFKALDYEGALDCIRLEDREKINIEDAEESVAYSMLLSRMSYKIGDSLTDEQGGRYLEVEISAPSMLDVYGEVVLLMNDAVMSGQITSPEELREFNDQAFLEVMENESIGTSTMTVYIELKNDTDEALRVVFTTEILNAMLGDIQNASQQVNDALSEGMNEYTTARDAGAFD